MIADNIYLSELLNRPVFDREGNEMGKVKVALFDIIFENL